MDGQNLELLPYKKNISFKWEKLQFNKEENKNKNDEENKAFNLWENNFELQKNIHITDNLKIHYNYKDKCIFFKLKIDYINGTIESGQTNQNLYFRSTSLIQTGLIYDIFNAIEDKAYEKLNIKFFDIINRGLIRINCKQKIPLDKVVYFKDLTVVFNSVDRLNYRGKTKYCIVCNIIEGSVLLQ